MLRLGGGECGSLSLSSLSLTGPRSVLRPPVSAALAVECEGVE